MKHVFQAGWSLKQEPIGPLVEYLDPFVSHLAEQGFCRRHLGRQLRVAANFSRWLYTRKIQAIDLTQAHTEHFLKGPKHQQSLKHGKAATLRRLVEFLQQLGVSPEPVCIVNLTPIQQILQSFNHYLVDERNLSPKTFIQYAPFIERFLSERFDKEPVQLSALAGMDVIGFIQRQTKCLSIVRAKVATNALRCFLRYAVYHGDINVDLIDAVPTVASWSMTGIPRAISPDHIESVLAHCSRDTTSGRRDYAILMLLVHLGLRSGEIVSLKLESIDWQAGSIAVGGKAGQSGCLPLPTVVGEAIADYLKNGRPHCHDRALFLRALAPIQGLGAQQSIGTIVNAAITRAGVDSPSRGAHQFRHAVATNLLRQGASLTEIGSLLRHQHPKTTNIYAKVDIEALRSLSMPWPGGAQ
jgi:integrase/recombinase XerD